MVTDFVSELSDRGMVHQVTSPDLSAVLRAGPVTGYIGFDPTAASLHVGSLLPVLTLVRLQQAGHRAVALVGGGTGLIGDPSGKQSERVLLTRDKLAENLGGLREQLGRYVDLTDPARGVMVDNADWLCGLPLVGFLRDVGKHFSVSAMVARDSVAARLEREQGLSFTEFTYMLLQAYDYMALYDRLGCTLQCGGSDQWGNIVSGVDLIRRTRGAQVHGLTFPLVTRTDGNKFGKSEEGNIWLDPALTSPYAFYQFWFNTPDADVERRLREFSFLSLGEITATISAHGLHPDLRAPQRTLAESVTAYVHGTESLARVQRTATALFYGGDWTALSPEDLSQGLETAPSTLLSRDTLGTPEALLVGLLVSAGVYPSRAQARTGIQQGGVSINNTSETDPQRVLTVDDLLPGGFIVLRKGKRDYHVLRCATAS